jgi:hypothetical protein
MPRYFFTIHRQDRVEDDRDGTYLPDADAALSYADYTIRELRKKSGYKDDLSLAMIVGPSAEPSWPGETGSILSGADPGICHMA